MRHAIFLAALALLLSGCSISATSQSAGGCKPSGDVNVLVVGSQILVDPEPVTVCAKNVKITWVIDRNQQQTYQFREDSIQVDDYDDEFDNCKLNKPGGEGKGDLDGTSKITCKDKNNKEGQTPPREYKYNIKVYYLGGGEATRSDPIIANN